MQGDVTQVTTVVHIIWSVNNSERSFLTAETIPCCKFMDTSLRIGLKSPSRLVKD